MTLQEASKRFDIPVSELQKYEKNKLLQRTGGNEKLEEYEEDDFKRLGFIQFLLSEGFSIKETKKYLELMKDSKTKEEQIRMLRKQRFELLEGIHEKQKLLDQIDYMIWEKNRR